MVQGTGSASNSIGLCRPGATDLTPAAGTTFPLTVIARMASYDQQNVDSRVDGYCRPSVHGSVEGRFSTIHQDFGQSGGIRSGEVIGNLHGFRVFVSNNLPSIGTGMPLLVVLTLPTLEYCCRTRLRSRYC